MKNDLILGKKLSRSEKIVLALLLSILAVQLIFSIIGFQKDELTGYIVFGFIVGAVLLNIVILASYFSTKRAFNAVRYFWLISSLTILFVGFQIVRPNVVPYSDREIGMIIGYPMAVLSIPVGPITSAVISNYLPDLRPNGFYLGNVYDWLILLLLGYVQWFVFFPAVIALIRRNRT